MSISAFSHSFRIAHIAISKNLDTRLNIQKRREKVVFSSRTDRDKINLSYTTSKEVNSDNNLFVSDRSNRLPSNTLPEDNQPYLFNGGSITLPVDKFQVTDVFTTSISSQEDIPLFYKHVLEQYDSGGDYNIVDIKIVDDNLENLTLSTVLIDKDEGIVYNNLANTFNYNTSESTIYYIKYTIHKISDDTIQSYVEILNNQNVFSLATTDDLDGFGIIIPTHKVYLLDEIGTSFEVTVPTIGFPYAIRETLDSRIKIERPVISSIRNPWFVKVTNGHFFTTLPNVAGLYKYRVAEFNNQLFDPFSPYKFEEAEYSVRINNHLIKLAKEHLFIDHTYPIYIVIFNPDNTPRIAVTTDPGLLGSSFLGSTIIWQGIRSIDNLNGIVDLAIPVKDTDVIRATYHFEEVEYEITDIDFNPLSNRDILGSRIIFYIVPDTLSVRTKTIFYLVVDKRGIIIDTNQTDNTDLLTAISLDTLSLKGSSPSFELDFSIEGINSNQYLILAEVFTNENSHPENTILFDVRKPGGGIKDIPELIQELAETVAPEIIWTEGVAPLEGFQFPGNGAYLIEIPSTLQKTLSGRFTDPALRELIEKHTAAGIYPIIKGYNCLDLHLIPIPRIVIGEGLTPATGTLTFTGYEDALVDISDGDTFTLNDGSNTPSIFEFDQSGDGVAPGHIIIEINTAVTDADVQAAIISAINGASNLDITASIGAGNGIVNLTNDTSGFLGNITILATADDGGITVSGMSGGTGEIEATIDLTWRSYGSPHAYNIYIATERTGPFDRVNALPIDDIDDMTDSNTYTISGLEPSTRYYIYSVCIESNTELPNTIIGSNPTGIIPVYRTIIVDTITISP